MAPLYVKKSLFRISRVLHIMAIVQLRNDTPKAPRPITVRYPAPSLL